MCVNVFQRRGLRKIKCHFTDKITRSLRKGRVQVRLSLQAIQTYGSPCPSPFGVLTPKIFNGVPIPNRSGDSSSRVPHTEGHTLYSLPSTLTMIFSVKLEEHYSIPLFSMIRFHNRSFLFLYLFCR